MHCPKVKSTKWLKQNLKTTIGGQDFEQTNGRSGSPFPLRFTGGQQKCVRQAFECSPKFSSSGLAIP